MFMIFKRLKKTVAFTTYRKQKAMKAEMGKIQTEVVEMKNLKDKIKNS